MSYGGRQCVECFHGCAGVGLTNGIVVVRHLVDPMWSGPPNKPQDVLSTSAAYGLYMSVSSNLRYQIIAGECAHLNGHLS